MGIKIFDKYEPKERELPSEADARMRKEHPEWCFGPPPSAEEKRKMDSVGFGTGTRPDPAAVMKQQDVPARFPCRQVKGDLESDRPAAIPDPSPFKLGR